MKINNRRQRELQKNLRSGHYFLAYGYDYRGIHPRLSGPAAYEKRRVQKQRLKEARQEKAKAKAAKAEGINNLSI